MSPGDFLTILFLAYQDMEAEKKRKKEEELKKQGKRKLNEKEQAEINRILNRGGRLPAEVIAKLQKKARDNKEKESSSFGNFSMEDLIDEL